MLKQWDERPQDVSHLLNPSFVGLLLYRAAVGFKRETQHGVPIELLVLVPSFVIHPATRQRLPKTIVTTLPTWLQDERDVIVRFGERTRNLMPYSREAMLWLLAHKLLLVDDEGRMDIGEGRVRGVTNYQKIGDEIEGMYKRAEFVGRWLAHSGTPTTIYALLGIRP